MMKLQEINQEWQEALRDEFQKDYYINLMDFVSDAYENNEVFPPANEVFNALNYTPLSKVKAVIIGQDPYHDNGQAHGLCFSVKPGVKIPPSLVNIYKELHDDIGFEIPQDGYLVKWADQGVLMINTVLTVNAHEANSHKGKGWEKFTDAIIEKVNQQDRPIVFLLWGAPAQKKKKMLDNPKHLILEAPHPSPLSVYRGFWGCKHFSKTNEFFVANGETPIDWQI
ncbi:MAG: uracil-DNA glycosylase [Lachnospiraceae bacterium]|nr:uracil-DNA glycosylase [Lachnospiraceae bacterium]